MRKASAQCGRVGQSASITKFSLKFSYLKFHLNLPGANHLIQIMAWCHHVLGSLTVSLWYNIPPCYIPHSTHESTARQQILWRYVGIYLPTRPNANTIWHRLHSTKGLKHKNKASLYSMNCIKVFVYWIYLRNLKNFAFSLIPISHTGLHHRL